MILNEISEEDSEEEECGEMKIKYADERTKAMSGNGLEKCLQSDKTFPVSSGSFFLEDKSEQSNGKLKRYMYEIYEEESQSIRLYFVSLNEVEERFLSPGDEYQDFDCVDLLRGAFGLAFLQKEMAKLELIFQSETELKRFCLAVYRLTRNRSMKVYLNQIGCANDLDQLQERESTQRNSARTSSNSSLKESMGRQKRLSFLTVNVDNDSANLESSSRGEPVLRRDNSFSETLNKVLGDESSKAWNKNGDNDNVDGKATKFGRRVFSSQCLLFAPAPSGMSSLQKQFSRHQFEVYKDGYIIFIENNYSTRFKKAKIAHKCKKVLCSKFSAQLIEKGVFTASKFLLGVKDAEVSDIIICIDIYEDNINQKSKCIRAFVIFPSLEKSKEFLCAISQCVSIHNVLGFMVDMQWADEEGGIQGVRHALRILENSSEDDAVDIMETTADSAVQDSGYGTDQEDAPLRTLYRSSSFFKLSRKSVAGNESRVSINQIDQFRVIQQREFTPDILTAAVTYLPANGLPDATLSLDGVDLNRVKLVQLVLAILDTTGSSWKQEKREQEGSKFNPLSPLFRRMEAVEMEKEAKLNSAAKSIADTLAKHSRNINVLSLKYCNLNETALFKLFLSLRDNKTLTSLNLRGNAFTTDNVSASMGNLINFNAKLKDIDVQETSLGNVGATLISQALHINKTILSLNLSTNNIDFQGCVMLSAAIEENSSLTYLNLSRNMVGGRGVQSIAIALQKNNTLRHLDLSRQRLKGKIGQDGAKHLANCLMVNTSLRVLRIGRNRLGFEGTRRISGALLMNSSLQILDISCNKIGIEGAIQVANAVLQNSSLEYIVIGHRKLPICHLMGHFHENNRLSEGTFLFDLRESSCGISSQGGVEKTFDDDLEFEYNVYFANDCSRVHSDAVFNATRSSFQSIDLQVVHSSSNETEEDIPVFSISDEEAVFIAHILKENSRLEELRIDHTYLPIQKLRGKPYEIEIANAGIVRDNECYDLDLSNSHIKCPDAIVIGILIADNPRLRLLSLQGNDFSKTEGETWVSNGLSKNPSISINTAQWSAEEMYEDGYHQLASLKGVSASGAAIMPKRLEDWFDKMCLIGGAFSYYLDLLSDIYVTYLYSQNSSLYQTSWVVLSAFFLSLPTCMMVYSILWTTWTGKDWLGAFQRLMVAVFQLHPVLHVYESLLVGIETTGYLDTRFLEGVYENIPQVALQTYIMFLVSIRNGDFDLRVFISVVISLVSVSTVMVMLVDRGPVRTMCLGHVDDQPKMVKHLASALTIVLVGNHHRSGNMKQLVSYSCHTYAHYVLATLLQFSSVTVRVMSVSWLLASSDAYKVFVLGALLLVRIFFIICFDPKLKARSISSNFIWSAVYTLLTVVWDKDESSPVASHRAIVILNILSTSENVVFLGYAGFLSSDTQMSVLQKVMVCLIAVGCMLMSWYIFVTWKLPVHFPELYSQSKSHFIAKNTENQDANFNSKMNQDFYSKRTSLFGPFGGYDSSQPVRHYNREKTFGMVRQKSCALQDAYEKESEGAQGSQRKRLIRQKSTWWSSTKPKKKPLPADRDLSMKAIDSGEEPISSIKYHNIEEGQGSPPKKTSRNSREEVVGAFRHRTASSISRHRNSRYSWNSSMHSHKASDVSGSVVVPLTPSQSSSTSTSDVISKSESGQFDYDCFIPESRESRESRESVISSIEKESRECLADREDLPLEKKHQHLSRFRLGKLPKNAKKKKTIQENSEATEDSCRYNML